MKRLLSPRELADAIGVSESSLKRWADAGKVHVSRTDGGHRRIELGEAVRFIRATGATVVRPDLLGLIEVSAAGDTDDDDALFHHLHDGDGAAVRSFLVGRFLRGHSVAALADGPIRGAMTRLGDLWNHDARGVFIEHRATDLCIQAVVALRGLVEPPANGPIAVGGAPAGDPYLLPSMLAATVLSAEGLRAINLGPDTPLPTLRHAIAHHRPRLAWLSLSSPATDLADDVAALARELAAAGRILTIGGRRRADVAGARAACMVASMGELAAFARGLLAGGPAAPAS